MKLFNFGYKAIKNISGILAFVVSVYFLLPNDIKSVLKINDLTVGITALSGGSIFATLQYVQSLVSKNQVNNENTISTLVKNIDVLANKFIDMTEEIKGYANENQNIVGLIDQVQEEVRKQNQMVKLNLELKANSKLLEEETKNLIREVLDNEKLEV